MPTGVYLRTQYHIQKLKECNNSSRFKIGHKVPDEWRKKLKDNKTGKKIIFVNPIQRGKNISLAKKGVPHFNQRGKNSRMWKGGISPINDKIRGSLEYKLWSDSIWNRDGNCCQKCGENRISKLVAHHIQNFSQFPELRFAIDNGITFCRDCHKEFHKKYSKQNNNREQLEEFQENKLNKDDLLKK